MDVNRICEMVEELAVVNILAKAIRFPSLIAVNIAASTSGISSAEVSDTADPTEYSEDSEEECLRVAVATSMGASTRAERRGLQEQRKG